MNSPLNSAHQQERKAEKFINCERYEEAISCYENASVYIIEAMKSTTCFQALLSMRLQLEDHSRKKKLLQIKIRNIALTVTENLNDSLSDKPVDKRRLPDLNTENERLDTGSNSEPSLHFSQDIFYEKKTLHDQSNVDDLQMQVLTLTQALEDSNRENNHLRSIVICFKEVLQERFGLSEEEVEQILIDNKSELSPNIPENAEHTNKNIEESNK